MQSGFGDFHAIVHFADQEKLMHFWIEVKSNGEKRFINRFMLMASRYKSEDCFILTRRIILFVSGKANKFIVKREKKNYLSKSSGAASAIIRTMLNTPKQQWQVITLVEVTGKAIGTVSNVKSFLRDRDWIKDCGNEFKLCNIQELLYVCKRISGGQVMAKDEELSAAGFQHFRILKVNISFLGITDEEERERIKQDVYQKVHYLVNKLKKING